MRMEFARIVMPISKHSIIRVIQMAVENDKNENRFEDFTHDFCSIDSILLRTLDVGDLFVSFRLLLWRVCCRHFGWSCRHLMTNLSLASTMLGRMRYIRVGYSTNNWQFWSMRGPYFLCRDSQLKCEACCGSQETNLHNRCRR